MWRRAVAAVALALACAPVAGARTFSVGYGSPRALTGLHVLVRIAQLHVAEVAAPDAAALRRRPGIRWVGATVPRRHLGERAGLVRRSLTAAEWQLRATHADLVPGAVQRAAAHFTVAVVDTGADVLAPALAAKHPRTWNVVTHERAVSDVTGHGTFVASIAAGADAPGSLRGFGGDAKLMIVQANRDADTFDDADEAAAIVWAVDHGARIVNLSIGGADTSRVERTAVRYAIAHGVLLVAAAGNTGEGGDVRSYPAALLGAHGLAVAASTAGGRRAPFSTSASYVSLAAPGVRVLGATTAAASRSAYPLAPVAAAGLYAYASGTSYAAPQVAGAAALVWAADPRLSRDEVVRVLERSASGGGAWNPGTGFGVLDVAAAVRLAARDAQMRVIAAPRSRSRSSIRS